MKSAREPLDCRKGNDHSHDRGTTALAHSIQRNGAVVKVGLSGKPIGGAARGPLALHAQSALARPAAELADNWPALHPDIREYTGPGDRLVLQAALIPEQRVSPAAIDREGTIISREYEWPTIH